VCTTQAVLRTTEHHTSKREREGGHAKSHDCSDAKGRDAAPCETQSRHGPTTLGKRTAPSSARPPPPLPPPPSQRPLRYLCRSSPSDAVFHALTLTPNLSRVRACGRDTLLLLQAWAGWTKTRSSTASPCLPRRPCPRCCWTTPRTTAPSTCPRSSRSSCRTSKPR
jgi:hypothetical protein